jgi:hypothetical protein
VQIIWGFQSESANFNEFFPQLWDICCPIKVKKIKRWILAHSRFSLWAKIMIFW